MNQTLIDLGWIQIRWYSIFILFAILTAAILVSKEAKKKGLEKDTLLDLIFYTVIFGILGARIYYVLFNLSYYLNNPIEIICIWHGGLAIHGGLIAALIYLLIETKKKKINFLLLLDIVVVGLILAQAIGRWGNMRPTNSIKKLFRKFASPQLYHRRNVYRWCLPRTNISL